MKEVKQKVTEQLLAVARVIRRRGTPDEAAVAVEYERQFERELKQADITRSQRLAEAESA